MDRRQRTNTDWSRVVVVAGVLLGANLLPAKRRDPPQPPPYGVDKALHGVGHGTLAVALVEAFDAGEWSAGPSIVAVVLSTGYGLALELLQQWIPGRRYERGDVFASLVGSVLAVALFRWRASESRSTGSSGDPVNRRVDEE
jgi:VanZ family protein